MVHSGEQVVLDLVVESSVELTQPPAAKVGRRHNLNEITQSYLDGTFSYHFFPYLLIEEALILPVLVAWPGGVREHSDALVLVAQEEEEGEVVSGDEEGGEDLQDDGERSRLVYGQDEPPEDEE